MITCVQSSKFAPAAFVEAQNIDACEKKKHDDGIRSVALIGSSPKCLLWEEESRKCVGTIQFYASSEMETLFHSTFLFHTKLEMYFFLPFWKQKRNIEIFGRINSSSIFPFSFLFCHAFLALKKKQRKNERKNSISWPFSLQIYWSILTKYFHFTRRSFSSNFIY